MIKQIFALAVFLMSIDVNATQGWKADPELCHKLSTTGWTKPGNYQESKVPEYTLPDPLVSENGVRITTREAWHQHRRPEILELFKTHVYGRAPLGAPTGMSFELFESNEQALNGKAIRKQVRIHLTEHKNGPSMDLLLYLPKSKSKPNRPAPVFLGLNFKGNHTVADDVDIRLTDLPHRQTSDISTAPDISSRGTKSSVWQIEMLLEEGYGVATVYSGDIDPDFHDEFKNGVHGAFDDETRKPDAWGSIAAWAWGLSRALDYLERDESVDSKRIAVIGHSRLGKAALWAGALDERFAMVISNNSGCGGAALNRRAYGETVHLINRTFPHWFCDTFKHYNNNESALPVDQHLLIALIAPRPVYVASADEDLWADPRGEFLSCKHASPVYELLGFKGLGVESMPSLDAPLQKGKIGYHIRSGEHVVLHYDWKRYIEFANKHLK